MAQLPVTRTLVCDATLGALTMQRLLVAHSPWSRLRGWYGYQPNSGDRADPGGLDGVLLTHTSSIHTLAMGFALDVFWLDKGMHCIGWQLNVRPWRCSWNLQAAHVLERPATSIDRQTLNSVCQQRLQLAPLRSRD
ncbi:MAG: DUF192 domain-containing protein [Idiomarina sp.]|nr:DUF192 domain-containing protein [Idiomarina sp.]